MIQFFRDLMEAFRVGRVRFRNLRSGKTPRQLYARKLPNE